MIIVHGAEPLADLEALAYLLGRSRETIRRRVKPVRLHNRWPFQALYEVDAVDKAMRDVPERKRAA